MDIQSSASATGPTVIRREDYRVPDWLVPTIALDFDLAAQRTLVTARLEVRRNGAHDRPLRLDGDELTPLSVMVDGQTLEPGQWTMEGPMLVVPLSGDTHVVETVVALSPLTNSRLMGLYASGGLLCTQCEAEGFRRITFFPDRPDVLSRYTVRMEADKATYPVLLSNGDLIESGALTGGRHWALWSDPFPKPSYLFALVAGDLKANRDRFTTMSGRAVDLGIWVREEDLPRTGHAMKALKDSMKWDEEVFGREYDLAQFNIVAVSDFNFGAMENKGLNIFNSRYVLADPDTATDMDFDGVEGVVAHEYFHNWSGNRITCRDWFQLSLKEGFTVYRDQQFSADMGSPAVKRIEDVRLLRAAQFPEDAGPLAHPVRPESYMEISNFYTATIYNKGAELIRMMALMMGPERFRRATDLYFDRHDGQAATCEDFVAAMEDGGDIDLSAFRRWYEQAGTPRVKAELHADPAGGATLVLEQKTAPTPGQPDKKPLPIPLRVALFDAAGGQHSPERLIVFDSERAEIRFDDAGAAPVLSINRGFSAPVIVETERSDADLAFLSAHDDDPFARMEALQQLMVNRLVGAVSGDDTPMDAVVAAVRQTLTDPTLDAAFIADAVSLPTEAYLGDQMLVVDPDAIHAVRQALRQRLGRELEAEWRAAYARSSANGFSLSPEAKGARKLRSVALGYIVAGGASDGGALAFSQFESADNMTDRMGALTVLASSDAAERVAALDIFYNRYRGNALVIDKWFQVQALAGRSDTLAQVAELSRHGDFTLANPNRARALWGAFAANPFAFHEAGGEGYRMLADAIIALDAINPQTAARLVAPLGRWRRYDEGRSEKMRAALRRIADTPGLSKDVTEQVVKSLG